VYPSDLFVPMRLPAAAMRRLRGPVRSRSEAARGTIRRSRTPGEVLVASDEWKPLYDPRGMALTAARLPDGYRTAASALSAIAILFLQQRAVADFINSCTTIASCCFCVDVHSPRIQRHGSRC
jgi:hypothetical protein